MQRSSSIVREVYSSKLFDERKLGELLALVRLWLAVINFAVVGLGNSIPWPPTSRAVAWAMLGASVFAVYATVIRLALQQNRIELGTYLKLSPVLDVVFASVLIIATRGYLSPFSSWMIFAVLASGFSHDRRYIFLTAVMAILAQGLIAMIPQVQPLNVSLFAIQTAYLFAVAIVLSTISSFVVRQSCSLSDIEDVSQTFGQTMKQRDALQLLVDSLCSKLNLQSACIRLHAGECIEQGSVPPGTDPAMCCALRTADESFGELELHRETALTRDERAVVRVLCEHAASAFLRIQLSKNLVAAAMARERVRLTDELHDTFLQALAALDMRAEVAARLAQESPEQLGTELHAIKEIARSVSTELRESLMLQPSTSRPGADTVKAVMEERWDGYSEIEIDHDVELSAGQWWALEKLVKEGLNNAVKHAHATRVSLRIRRANGKITCLLENNGDVIRTPVQFGYGLTRLRTVVAEQQGFLRLELGNPQGARLIAEFEAEL